MHSHHRGAMSHPQHGAPSPVAARLGHVAERFSSFYNDLEAEKQHRRDAESQRRHNFNEQLTKLERSLEVRPPSFVGTVCIFVFIPDAPASAPTDAD